MTNIEENAKKYGWEEENAEWREKQLNGNFKKSWRDKIPLKDEMTVNSYNHKLWKEFVKENCIKNNIIILRGISIMAIVLCDVSGVRSPWYAVVMYVAYHTAIPHQDPQMPRDVSEFGAGWENKEHRKLISTYLRLHLYTLWRVSAVGKRVGDRGALLYVVWKRHKLNSKFPCATFQWTRAWYSLHVE